QFELAELPIEIEVTHAQDVVEGILAAAVNCDQIVIGASEERLLEQSLFGSIPQRVAEEAPVTTVMVKRHDLVKFGLRRWLFARKR
ncbi:MAG: universal stress protein, partial [Caldilineaceae bacterium]|nr:universal stress protein [Caldilineaceae bacterium]